MTNERPPTLGDFLRHRRGLITPEQVGLPRSARRRVPGLRREELAIVAGISPDHYQRIEQDRVRPSMSVLDALAAALDLDPIEREHLRTLGSHSSIPRSSTSSHLALPPQSHEHLQPLLGAFNGPAYLLNHRRDVLAWNAMGSSLITDFSALPRDERNIAWITFTDPSMRTLYRDWAKGAQEQVALLRRAVGRYPHDEKLQRLIGRLSAESPDFANWWSQQRVMEKTSGHKTLNHPQAGVLDLDFHTLQIGRRSDLELFVYLPGTPTASIRLATLRTTHTPAKEDDMDYCQQSHRQRS